MTILNLQIVYLRMISMNRIAIILFLLYVPAFVAFGQPPAQVTTVAPGVMKVASGRAERFSPYSFCSEKPVTAAMSRLPEGKLPFNINDIKITTSERGVLVEIPLDNREQLYGFGLQMGSFNQKGLRKKPIVNDNPSRDLGYSHAPMPFYVSNKGYGILVNTSHYTTFYCGTTAKNTGAVTRNNGRGGNSAEELYRNDGPASGYVAVDIPGVRGIEVYVFEGPELVHVLQRYNLFSGGGALPAMWGLGVKYRVKADFTQQQVGKMAAYFRANAMPCDVLGLEPKWQTAAYSCSYVWNEDFFPSHDKFIDTMRSKGFHINLWEHAFVNPRSPLYAPLKKKSGDYLVWNGLVPDFADSSARQLFAAYHKATFVSKGISGFKMDECDNSNLATGSATWSFPEHSRFPSGIDGEQMHQVFGVLYQKTVFQIYKALNTRTFLDVRASNAFASSYPASLYSDTYDHHEYIQMISNAGFSGLLWSPEVRESKSIADLMRRSQTAVLSAQTLYNSWYLQHPPWLQINIGKNNKNELMDNAKAVEADVRKLLDFRMSLVPYLYSAFAVYHTQGIPPFRALVVDYPDDEKIFNIDDEYMIGEGILAAPLTADSDARKVYLPAGNWYEFNTRKKYAGGREYIIKTGYTDLPVFIKEGTILPLAEPVQYIGPDTRFELTCYVYGDQAKPAYLFEDDGVTFAFEKGKYNNVILSYGNGKGAVTRKGNYAGERFRVKKWEVVR
ncbi:TIM-barrel domain-containing protein [Mucilaginibacter sp. L3T2-6]|uniref:glycoside hydrolase family 31 protein n=1 Tax=Mucilaginibacter sp. L3T2-6 TaxID=3062491 RepID=UPI002674F0FA|nr:TIM-barrel domain-containing protein [Mucilaginibacter sp. L3T2-6]MDO3645328.1 glycoside hydrolase family 31 protein [Mucilaginibacter sp. L3T2-6]MDV6217827.1 glycoside hydrolase family 31 protein [Mucilaginibacter sp. L3T2-6]